MTSGLKRALIMIMKKSSGFTLLELMVVVAIGAILLAIGVPSLKPFVQGSRMTSITNELVAALNVARSEAIRRGSTGCVCASSTASTAAPACDAGGNWESGWISFLDVAGDCVYADGADDLLKVWDGTAVASPLAIRNNNALITAPGFVRFNSRGMPNAGGGLQMGTFSICDDRGNVANVDGDSKARAVILSAAGSARSTRKANLIDTAICP